MSLYLLSGDAAAQTGVATERDDLGSTTLIKFVGIGESSVVEVRLWLEEGAAIESFKTETGWTGQVNSAGVLVVTAATPPVPGESVKVGIVTDGEAPRVGWRAVNESGETVNTAWSTAQDPPIASEPPPDDPEQDPELPTQPSVGITGKSMFRAAPSDPGAGSLFRVTGDSFGAGQQLELLLGGQALGAPFLAGADGSFTVTRTVPAGQTAGSATLAVRDQNGQELTVNISITNKERPARETTTKPLALDALPADARPGTSITVSGTGNPESWLRFSLASPETLLATSIVRIDSSGSWSFDVAIPSTAPFGSYTATVADGFTEVSESLNVEIVRTVQINAKKDLVTPGDAIEFTVTAEPGTVEVIVKDPEDFTAFRKHIPVSSNGSVDVQYATLRPDSGGSYHGGTHILIAKQGGGMATTTVGVGTSSRDAAEDRLVVELDKVHYSSSESAVVLVTGIRGTNAELVIVDDQGKALDTIFLKPTLTGTAEYHLDLDVLLPGAHTATVSSIGDEARYDFVVDPNTGDSIFLSKVENIYFQGANIGAVITTQLHHTAFSLKLVDPEGVTATELDLFTDRNADLQIPVHIPADAKSGTWTIEVDEGSNSDVKFFAVFEFGYDGLVMSLSLHEEGGFTFIDAAGSGAGENHNMKFVLTYPDGSTEEAEGVASPRGTFNTSFAFGSGVSGTYTVNATDAQRSGSTVSQTIVVE